MADLAAGVSEEDLGVLIAALAAFRKDRLQGQPSTRTLATAAGGISPTTIVEWLRGKRFPQQVEQLLAVVRAVRAQAGRARLADDPAAAVLSDEQRWRDAYRAEARHRTAGTRAAVQAGQGQAVLERMRPGWPLSEVKDPFQFGLEVHRAINTGDAGLPALPAYVPRAHDHVLAEVVAAAADGHSGIAVLVGGSSTGKTRACWQALNLLGQGPWRLWHPIYPTHPAAALTDLPNVAPYTVVWLNEAQFYLTPDQVGEQVAAGLRELLRDPGRGPVLVLATLWPQHWNALTSRSESGSSDPHAQARELLTGHKIDLLDAFTGADLAALTRHADRDPRLTEASEHAEDGQITQYLAGVPLLLNRYGQAPPATEAVIHAAMDARRLGAGIHLPLTFLAEAAPGYLTDAQWQRADDDWLQQALDYAATPCNGIPGILTPVKTGAPRNQRSRRTSPAAARTPAAAGPLYRLADYLDQHGRRHRADKIPPIDFWTAAALHARPADLAVLGDAARARGLYRDAAQLHKHATFHGAPYAAVALVRHLHTLHPTDRRPAQHAIAHVALDDPFAVGVLLDSLREAGAEDQVRVLAERAIAHVALDDPFAVGELLDSLWKAGVEDQVRVLLAGDPATHAALDYPFAVSRLLDSLREAGAEDQVRVLAERAAAHVALDDPDAVGELLDSLREA
ncbi:hypothetical protein ACFWX0_51925, partial [Nonomuraea sp. NPDC059022]